MRPWHPGCEHPPLNPDNDQFCIFCLRKRGDDALLRVAKLERALREIVELAGNASISVETLAAFSPLTSIIVTASEALDARRSTGPEGK